MTPLREEALLWLRQSEAELRAARHSFEAGDWFAAVFWCHQAAEKALKALLIAGGVTARGHDLLSLLRRIREEIHAEPPGDVERCVKRLNPHYMVSRYPDAANGLPYEMYTREDAEEALRCAETILGWVRRLLR